MTIKTKHSNTIYYERPPEGTGVQLVVHDVVHPYRVWFEYQIAGFCVTEMQAFAGLSILSYGGDVDFSTLPFMLE